MTKSPLFSRYKTLVALLVCYLLPLSIISHAYLAHHDFGGAWQHLSATLLITSLGSLTLFFIISRWEAMLNGSLQRVPENPEKEFEIENLPSDELNKTLQANQEALATTLQLQRNLELNESEIQRLKQENTSFEEREKKLLYDLKECRASAEHELIQQQQSIRALQQNIAEQKSIVEKKQQQIATLESKVSDLTYEIKTLLQIAEAHTTTGALDAEPLSPPPSLQSSERQEIADDNALQNEKKICTAEEASLQLRRCLDIAQKITGSNRFSQMSAFLDSPADSFSIDLRRLYESLRSEKCCAILFYSPKENQLLFANHQVKGLIGWSPEKFVQNFSRLLIDETAWRSGVAALAMRSEVQLKLSFKTKSGSELQLDAHLGMIPTGIFKYHTLAVLY